MDFTPILQMSFDFVKSLVPQKTGTKFLIGIGGISTILYMAVKNIGTNIHIYAICAIILIYFIADIISKFISKPQEKEGAH